MSNIRTSLANRFGSGTFLGNVLTLMTGSVFAQSLVILISPILTRLYSPDDYGVYNLFTSISSILAVIACMRYEGAIVLPEEDEDAANVLALCISVCLGMAFLVLVIGALFHQAIANLFNTPILKFWIWFIPLSIIADGFYHAFNYWSTRRRQFKRLAMRQITVSSVTSLTQVGAGATLHPGPGGLILGVIIGQMTATLRLGWEIFREEGSVILSAINRASIRQMAERYKQFPLFSSWAALLTTSSNMMPVLMLAYFFNPAIVGIYGLGNRVLSVPILVVGNAVHQVFFPQAVDARRDGHLDIMALGMFNTLLSIGFVPIVLIAVVAPDLFGFVFGQQWKVAGEYVRWLSIFMLLMFVSAPMQSIYAVMERQKDNLIISAGVFVIRLSALVIGGRSGNAYFTVALFGITEACFRLFNCGYILHLAGVGVNQTIKTFIKQFLYALPYALIPVLVWVVSHNSAIFLTAGIGAGILFLIVRAQSFTSKHKS